MSDKTKTVQFYGRDVKGETVADGVIRRASRKGAKSFLVQCSQTGKWCYTSPERMDKLVQRFGSEADVGKGYISREGKALVKEQSTEVEATTSAE